MLVEVVVKALFKMRGAAVSMNVPYSPTLNENAASPRPPSAEYK